MEVWANVSWHGRMPWLMPEPGPDVWFTLNRGCGSYAAQACRMTDQPTTPPGDVVYGNHGWYVRQSCSWILTEPQRRNLIRGLFGNQRVHRLEDWAPLACFWP